MQRFQGVHQRDEDEYEEEDYDEYEEDASEEEEEEREEPISQEEQEFLKLREELKEKFRQKLKKQTAAAFGPQGLSQEKRRAQTNDTFGSFFGPSKPVIASRVIDERRSIQETQHIISRAPSSSSGNSKDAASTSSGQKMHVIHKPKVVNEVKKKAQTLKDMRDYSFLLSDDADIPPPAKEERQLPASRSGSALKSDVQSAHVLSKSRPPTEASSSKSRQATGALLKGRPPMAAKRVSNGPELNNSSSKNMPSRTRVAQTNGTPINKPRPGAAEARKVSGGNTANGYRHPVQHKNLASNRPVQATGAYQPPSTGIKDPNLKRRPSVSAVPHSSIQKNHHSEQWKPNGSTDRVKAETKRPLPSKPSAAKPQKHTPHHDVREDQRKKKAVKRRFDEEDDDEDAIGLIRKMFRYDPDKYAGMDEDDKDMEADFMTIEKEERRSSKIAKKEDEEQLRLIEEEERRERMRKKQKQRRG